MGVELLHADGRKDRHDEGDSHFSQLCERVKISVLARETNTVAGPCRPFAVLSGLTNISSIYKTIF